MHRMVLMTPLFLSLISACVVRTHSSASGATVYSLGGSDESRAYPSRPPPGPITEARTNPPGVGYRWVDGYWDWSGSDWTWADGYWAPERAGYVFVRPTYLTEAGKPVLVRGYWGDRAGHRDYEYERTSRSMAAADATRRLQLPASEPPITAGTASPSLPEPAAAPRPVYLQPAAPPANAADLQGPAAPAVVYGGPSPATTVPSPAVIPPRQRYFVPAPVQRPMVVGPQPRPMVGSPVVGSPYRVSPQRPAITVTPAQPQGARQAQPRLPAVSPQSPAGGGAAHMAGSRVPAPGAAAHMAGSRTTAPPPQGTPPTGAAAHMGGASPPVRSAAANRMTGNRAPAAAVPAVRRPVPTPVAPAQPDNTQPKFQH